MTTQADDPYSGVPLLTREEWEQAVDASAKRAARAYREMIVKGNALHAATDEYSAANAHHRALIERAGWFS